MTGRDGVEIVAVAVMSHCMDQSRLATDYYGSSSPASQIRPTAVRPRTTATTTIPTMITIMFEYRQEWGRVITHSRESMAVYATHSYRNPIRDPRESNGGDSQIDGRGSRGD